MPRRLRKLSEAFTAQAGMDRTNEKRIVMHENSFQNWSLSGTRSSRTQTLPRTRRHTGTGHFDPRYRAALSQTTTTTMKKKTNRRRKTTGARHCEC